VLSHQPIIDKLNRDFIPLEVNLTNQKWPDELPALWGWKLAFEIGKGIYKKGFTSCIMVTPDGKTHLADAGNPGAENWRTSAHYHNDKFEAFLNEGLKKYKEQK